MMCQPAPHTGNTWPPRITWTTGTPLQLPAIPPAVACASCVSDTERWKRQQADKAATVRWWIERAMMEGDRDAESV